ncbi:MAG: 5-formyltetrahydrofolate cyclo-ligase [Rhodospirillales bacterium]|nr:5-formyltetrahydrofolate cyclo-ligase [Rhodospirillales bacterium]
MSKQDWRVRMRDLRDAIPEARRAAEARAIADRLLEMTPDSWFIYVSRGSEVDTHELIARLLERGDTVTVPLVRDDGKMEAHIIESLDALQPGRFGVLEPMRENLLAEPAVAIVPCLALTRSGVRLGQGGGYYDRYLAAHPDTRAYALAFAEQVVDELPEDVWDVRVRLV